MSQTPSFSHKTKQFDLLPLPPGCEVRCPGCEHRALSEVDSLAQKNHFLKATLNLDDEKIAPIRSVSGESRWGYRNKVCLRAFYQEGQWQFGFVIKKKKEIETVAIPRCPLHSIKINQIFSALSRALPPPAEFPMVFASISGSLLTLVLKMKHNNEVFQVLEPSLQSALSQLGIEGLFLNFNPSAGNRVFSSRGWNHVWGTSTALLKLGEPLHCTVSYGPECFLQLIPELYLNTLDESLRFLSPKAGDTVIDLYSGVGVSSRLWAEHGAKVIGVELNGQGIAYSKVNCPSGTFLHGRTSDRLKQISHGNLLFLNPPRTGVDPETLNWIAKKLIPQRIAYLSCSPGTLRRDLSSLEKQGYGILKIIPYDFFPNTRHIETLAFLEKFSD